MSSLDEQLRALEQQHSQSHVWSELRMGSVSRACRTVFSAFDLDVPETHVPEKDRAKTTAYICSLCAALRSLVVEYRHEERAVYAVDVDRDIRVWTRRIGVVRRR